MPYKLVKGITSDGWFICYRSGLATMSKGVSGCARHRPVYVYTSVKGSRVCKRCNVLDVRKYVRASMV